jgi:hypothetical protein
MKGLMTIDADDLPAAVKKSFDAMVEAEATFKADLQELLKAEGHMTQTHPKQGDVVSIPPQVSCGYSTLASRQEEGEMPFWICETQSEWSSFDRRSDLRCRHE